ncbi:hypothetical protein [Streptacidiphilus sp. PAMC 29251]
MSTSTLQVVKPELNVDGCRRMKLPPRAIRLDPFNGAGLGRRRSGGGRASPGLDGAQRPADAVALER